MLHTSILPLTTHILEWILITVNQLSSYVFRIEINYEEYKNLLEVSRKALLQIWQFELSNTQYKDESWIRICCKILQNFSCQNSKSYWRYQKCLSWKLKHLNSHLNLNPVTHEGFKKKRRERQRETERET